MCHGVEKGCAKACKKDELSMKEKQGLKQYGCVECSSAKHLAPTVVVRDNHLDCVRVD